MRIKKKRQISLKFANRCLRNKDFVRPFFVVFFFFFYKNVDEYDRYLHTQIKKNKKESVHKYINHTHLEMHRITLIFHG